MAVYKIPQDVEADDKFVGPLSFKQFIYMGIAVVASYLTFLSLTKGFWPALIIFAPVIIVGGFLGFPWGREQPTEIWLAARIRFFLKPRIRIWNQAGLKELVSITAPKHVEQHYTNGLTQNEVSSRLTGLADLLDSRGWAVKNVSANNGTYTSPLQANYQSEDRLLDLSALPQEVTEVVTANDVLDEANSPTAQNFDALIKTSEQKHRQELIDNLNMLRNPVTAAPPVTDQAPSATENKADFWFLQQKKAGHAAQNIGNTKVPEQTATPLPDEPVLTTFQTAQVVAPHAVTTPPANAVPVAAGEDEQALLNKIHKIHDQSSHQYGHLKTLQPLGEQPTVASEPPQAAVPMPAPVMLPPAPVTPPVNTDIIKLAGNDDLDVATIARQAEKSAEKRQSDGEVVISLR